MPTWVAASVSSPGTSMTSMPSVVRCSWMLGEELLDLFGREVFDRDRLEEVLRRYESSLAPSGDDLFLDLVDPERLTSSRGFAHRGFLRGCRARPPQCTERFGRRPGRGTTVDPLMTARRAVAAGCAGVRRPPRQVGGSRSSQPGSTVGFSFCSRMRIWSLRDFSRNSLSRASTTVRVLGRVVALERLDDERRDLTRERRIRAARRSRATSPSASRSATNRPPVRRRAEVVLGRALAMASGRYRRPRRGVSASRARRVPGRCCA